MSILKVEEEAEGSQKEPWPQKTPLRGSVAGSEDGKGPRAKECAQPLEAGKGEEMDSLLEPLEVNAALMAPGF